MDRGLDLLCFAGDSVTGGCSYSYDDLDRLIAATGNSGTFNGAFGVNGLTMGWTYDSFGRVAHPLTAS
jgi:hypothetical protein